MRMEISTDFTRVNDDPLATILALQQYPQAVLDLANAFIHIGALYKDAGIVHFLLEHQGLVCESYCGHDPKTGISN